MILNMLVVFNCYLMVFSALKLMITQFFIFAVCFYYFCQLLPSFFMASSHIFFIVSYCSTSYFAQF